MEGIDFVPLDQQKRRIRNLLQTIGTDCTKNDDDPYGNGDQSLIQTVKGRDTAREIFSVGGDIHGHFEHNGYSKFAMACIFGQRNVIKEATEEACNEEPILSRNVEITKLLETRETSLRLSPLLLIVSAGKNAQMTHEDDHVAIAKMLLIKGADPRAQDVLGKTVCHYGAGGMATDMTLKVVDMCINAAKTSHLFGQEVQLQGLKTIEMNAKVGIVGGYNPDSGRREIYLEDEGREIWVKPENIKVLDVASHNKKEWKMLADIQDRMGSVSLHEIIMNDRVDVAKFLLHKHKTSIHTKDMDGMTPMIMSGDGGMLRSKVCKMIVDIAREEGNARRKVTKNSCANCGKFDASSACAQCKITVYCSKECQRYHWKNGHKAECTKIAMKNAGIKLDKPERQEMYNNMVSLQTGKSTSGSYRKPRGVRVKEMFVVKIQAGGAMTPILIYDETRTCEFDIRPHQTGFQIILEETQKELTWNGRKTFMKASFDENGDCTIYPATAGVKKKYSW